MRAGFSRPAAAGLTIPSRLKPVPTTTLQSVTPTLWLCIVGLLPALLVPVELAARWWIRRRGEYYVLPPGLRLRLRPDPDVFPELERATRFDVNTYGERGDEVPRVKGLFRILVAGGSQPEGYLLDQETAWPGALQRLLQAPICLARLGATDVHVGSIARSGVGADALNLIVVRRPWFDAVYSPEAAAHMWHGGVGQAWRTDVTTYYSFDVVRKLMSLLDARAASIGDAMGIEHIDLMPILEGNLANYYDCFHATPAGAKVVASTVAAAVVPRRDPAPQAAEPLAAAGADRHAP